MIYVLKNTCLLGIIDEYQKHMNYDINLLRKELKQEEEKEKVEPKKEESEEEEDEEEEKNDEKEEKSSVGGIHLF